MGRLAPPNKTAVDSFPMPEVTLYFLGGPLDGYRAEPDVDDGLNTVYPDWILPRECEHMYWRVDADSIPAWIVQPPFMDPFDVVYLWGPYWPGHDEDDDEEVTFVDLRD